MNEEFEADLQKVRRFKTQTDLLPIGYGAILYAAYWFWEVALTPGEWAVVSVVGTVGWIAWREVREMRADFMHDLVMKQHGRQTFI
jgi:hypothetical protein